MLNVYMLGELSNFYLLNILSIKICYFKLFYNDVRQAHSAPALLTSQFREIFTMGVKNNNCVTLSFAFKLQPCKEFCIN